MKFNFIDHLSLIVRDLSQTEEFYSKFLGKPILRDEGLLVYIVGTTRLFFRQLAVDSGSAYNKDNTGINHIGIGVKTIDELEKFDQLFSEVSVAHSEVKTGKFGNKYIWFDDPDGIRLEIYHRPED